MGLRAAEAGRFQVPECSVWNFVFSNCKVFCILKHESDMINSVLEDYFGSSINCIVSLIHSFNKCLWKPKSTTCE